MEVVPTDHIENPIVHDEEAPKPKDSPTDDLATTPALDAPHSAQGTSTASSSSSSVPDDIVEATLASISALATSAALPPAPQVPASEVSAGHSSFAASKPISSSASSSNVSSASSSASSPQKEEKIPSNPPRVLVLFHGDETSDGTCISISFSAVSKC